MACRFDALSDQIAGAERALCAALADRDGIG
jgi:hypothetical protein